MVDGRLAFVVEKLLVAQSAELCLVDNCSQKVHHALLLIEYGWLWLFDFLAFYVTLSANLFDLLTQALYFLSVPIS